MGPSSLVSLYILWLSCVHIKLSKQVRGIPENVNETKYIGFSMYILLLSSIEYYHVAFTLACENSCFSSLFAAGDVSRGGTCATQRQKFHTDDVNQCLQNTSGSHGVPHPNLFNFMFLPVDFTKEKNIIHQF